MNLTGTDIEQDFYNMLKGSLLESAIGGNIYKSGMRPLNAKTEDVVITFLSGLSNQIQKGIVVINTYVPDLAQSELKNTSRIKALEAQIKNWFYSLENSRYELSLNRTIQVYAEPDINQHFINTRLNFKLLIQ